jgi:uncharacterized protein (TIGR02646 family)
MKRIVKVGEPNSLTTHRATAHSNYGNYPYKDALRLSLCREQRGICCYCMAPIAPGEASMKIEHWQCQTRYEGRQLEYNNLMGACLGGEGNANELQSCDTYKGNRDLSIYPPSRATNIELSINYRNNGEVYSDNAGIDQELNEVLNLNNPYLVNNRKLVLDSFKERLERYGNLNRPTLVRWVNDWSGIANTDNLHPYCMVIVYWLKKKLARP